MTRFRPEAAETLRQLASLWRDTPFVLIGANALALQIDLEWRQTNDLDFVVSVSLEEYPAGLSALPGWEPRREGEHAWLSPTGIKVDVVPASPGLLQAGSLTWPESGSRMSLVGLRLAFDHNVRVAIDERHSVQVAATPAIVVLKMVAFLDRPEREDDLTDIAQVVERYLGPVDDRRWTLPVDFDNAGAYALGCDIAALVNNREQEIVTRFLERARDEDDRYRTHALLIRNGPLRWRREPDVLFHRLAALVPALRHPSLPPRPHIKLDRVAVSPIVGTGGTAWVAPWSVRFQQTRS